MRRPQPMPVCESMTFLGKAGSWGKAARNQHRQANQEAREQAQVH